MRLLPVALIAAVGLAGAISTILETPTSLSGPPTLLFLLTGPALATWPLLPSLTPLARAIVSGSMTFVVNITVAQVMLSFGVWSIRGGVAAVMVICLLMALTDMALTRRAAPVSTDSPPEEEDWLFEL